MAVDWNDLVISPCLAEFGEAVSYTPAGGALIPGLTGVFDVEYLDLEISETGTRIGMPTNITTAHPVLGVQLSAFPAGISPAQGDAVTVLSNGVAYLVKEVRPDGHGWAKLLLNEAS